MLHFLVLVCRTLFPVSIVLGAMLGFAWQRQLFEVRTPAKYGAILGFITAAVLAGLKMGTGWIVREFYDLRVLCVMVPFEVLLVAGLIIGRKTASEKVAGPMMRIIYFMVAYTWTAFYLPDIFIYPSHFAVGVVKVVSSDFVFIVVGYLFGLILCSFGCRTAYRVCSQVPLKFLFPLVILLLLLFMSDQLIYISQICVGRGYLPRTDFVLDLVIFFLQNTWVIVTCLTGVSLLLAVILYIVALRTPIVGENPAEKRKVRSRTIEWKIWSWIYVVVLTLGYLTVTVGWYYDNLKVELSPPAEVTVVDGKILHPLQPLEDGHLHRFVYRPKSGPGIRYIIIKKSQSAYGVGLDACDVCGGSGGYYERKNEVVCILCDVVMNKSTIGFAGGCNPVPLAFIIRDGSLIINTSDLEDEQSRFY